MRQPFSVSIALFLGILFSFSAVNAQCLGNNNLNEPGSLLVWPLIDNINFNGTIVEVTNGSDSSVTLECNMVTHGSVSTTIDEKKDFYLKLTPKEKFWWNTAVSYNRTNALGEKVQLASFDDRKGYMFCWAVKNDVNRLEISHNYLRGEGLLFGASQAWAYNAIPHQLVILDANRVLDLNGAEYTSATNKIMFEGLAADTVAGLDGTLAIANIGIDFIQSIQPEFDINASCWNQDETRFSRHLHYKDYLQVEMSGPFQVRLRDIFTPGFNCELIGGKLKRTDGDAALWAVYYTKVGSNLAAGGNVWQDPNSCVSTQVVLAP